MPTVRKEAASFVEVAVIADNLAAALAEGQVIAEQNLGGHAVCISCMMVDRPAGRALAMTWRREWEEDVTIPPSTGLPQ
jgi:hypothetical protein